MKLVITHKRDINSPKKGEFVILSYLNPKSGETGQLFMRKENYVPLKFDESQICSGSTIEKMVEVADLVDVSFGPNREVESLG